MEPIPYSQIRTLFLDAGNTIIRMDMDWISEELANRGITIPADALRRAEAAARPELSRRLASLKSTESKDAFRLYMQMILSRLPAGIMQDRTAAETAAIECIATIRSSPDRDLWANVMPGASDILPVFRNLGLNMVVVSNSNGSMESLLEQLGLRRFFSFVVDSGVVGFEKPDPRIFQHALCIAGAKPEETLHVGDIYHADVLGARAAGIHAILLDPFGDWHDVDCETVPDLAALVKLFHQQTRRRDGERL